MWQSGQHVSVWKWLSTAHAETNSRSSYGTHAVLHHIHTVTCSPDCHMQQGVNLYWMFRPKLQVIACLLPPTQSFTLTHACIHIRHLCNLPLKILVVGLKSNMFSIYLPPSFFKSSVSKWFTSLTAIVYYHCPNDNETATTWRYVTFFKKETWWNCMGDLQYDRH